jgi:N,N-dimethylformamidase
LVNHPARAMTGSGWDGSEMNWQHNPEHYGAIHFHRDDIYDFGWQNDIEWVVPEDFASGVYVLRITQGGHEDAIPFYVCPPLGQRTADLAVLVSTFTHVIYGNHSRPDFKPEWMDRHLARGGYPYNPAQYEELGCSTYNFHRDGSGICHCSHLRPLLNTRPGYYTMGYGKGSGLRHFQADSHLIWWLHEKGIPYDIVTDKELHEEGYSAIQGYKTVTTGSHPEYHTSNTLDALLAFRNRGGNFMYLGGNGFYWRVAVHEQEHGIMEIRRGEGGIRAWAAEPGEYYNAFDGNYGGLWRRSGRPPQQLAGLGFTSQGQFEGTYYRRTEESYAPDLVWLFDGIGEEILGDFGFSGGGAAGYELDRADVRLGSPPNVRVLAQSEQHPDHFVLVPEELLTHLTTLPLQPIDDLIRADMIYFEVPGGGKVFSVGSITFCGSLPWNGGDNDISRLVENVLRRFLE